MKRALPILALLLLLTFATTPINTFARQGEQAADESTDVEDDAPVARVARLSFVEGDVSFLRAGVTDWAEAVENLPLLAGDQLYAGRGARAEIQLARGSYIRLSENTALTISSLSDSAAQFEVTEGIAIIRVERLAEAFQRFEVDTPNSALVLQGDGLYRVNVRGDDDSEVIVRRGEAEVSTDDGSFRVREGHRLLVDTGANRRLEIAIDTSKDDWDQWSYDRDTTIDATASSATPDYVTTYETNYNSFYGVSDLSSHGSWFNHSDYGYCWRPRVSHDWVPYRDGQWIWIPAAGWTWLARERWGWAPYHYGRWVLIAGYGWSWIPGIVVVRQHRTPWFFAYSNRYYRWRPALVHFYDFPTPRGRYVAWHPLAPNERWHRPDRDRRGADHSHLNYPAPRAGARRPDGGTVGIGLPRDRNGISILPVEGFTRPDRSRLRPVAPGREESDWISRGARRGLPEISPTPVASAPSRQDGGDRGSRRAVAPPSEIIRRSVVTRNRPPDDQAGVTAPARERRLINPGPGILPDGPSRRERRSRDGDERAARPGVTNPDSRTSGDESNSRPSRDRLRMPTVPQTNTGGDGDGSAKERKRERRNADVTTPATPEGSESKDANEPVKERRRNRPETTPTPTENPSAERPGDQQESRRERKAREAEQPSNQDDAQQAERNRRREEARQRREEARQKEESQQGQEPGSRPRDEERPRGRDRGESPERSAEPRHEKPQPAPETKAEPRQERRQEKEERRQERREERKKP